MHKLDLNKNSRFAFGREIPPASHRMHESEIPNTPSGFGLRGFFISFYLPAVFKVKNRVRKKVQALCVPIHILRHLCRLFLQVAPNCLSGRITNK